MLIRQLIRRLFNWLGRQIVYTICKFELIGVENVPREGRLIIIFNHINWLDAPLVAAFWPREVEIMTKAENLRSLFLGPLMRMYDAFPIRRGEVDRRALSTATWLLESEKVLLISPEGTRSHGHGLGEAKNGMALLAVRTSSPIIPVAVWGQEDVIRGLLRFKRAKVTMLVGKPFHFHYPSKGHIDRQALTDMTTEAMHILAQILPEDYRGAYSDLTNATRNYAHEIGGVAKEAASTAA